MYIHMFIVSIVRVIAYINRVFKISSSSQLWLLTPLLFFSLMYCSSLTDFIPSLPFSNILNLFILKTHSYSSIIHSSQTMISILKDWDYCPLHALELVPMRPSGSEWPSLGLCALDCGNDCVGWMPSLLSVPQSMGLHYFWPAFMLSFWVLCII